MGRATATYDRLFMYIWKELSFYLVVTPGHMSINNKRKSFSHNITVDLFCQGFKTQHKNHSRVRGEY